MPHRTETPQVTLRLPAELVAFVDGCVAAGEAHNRDAVIARALDRERRRAAAENDAIIYASMTHDDLAEAVRAAQKTSFTDLD